MEALWIGNNISYRKEYSSESELEKAIQLVKKDLFGSKRIYLDVKKKIGAKGGIKNIPDGYLIDLGSKEPRLYVVENELASHEPLKHIAAQILEFSLSFETDQHKVKSILQYQLMNDQDSLSMCNQYINQNAFRNLDHLLEHLVYDSPFTALVVIDEVPDNLEKILLEKFRFGVEIIELACYEDKNGNKAYQFTPFLADLGVDLGQSNNVILPDPSELDTIVVPAKEDGFAETFIGENRWYQIRIHGSMLSQIKYIAAYQVAPISAITYIAPVKSIEQWKDSAKFVVNFSESAKPLGPIRLVPADKGGRVKALQNIRYSSIKRLESAKTLDDVW